LTDPGRFAELDRLFDELDGCAAAEQAARLGRIAANRPDLAADLTALLAVGEGSPDFLAVDSSDLGAALAEALAADPSLAPHPAAAGGDRIGAWRLVAPLGSGGMGEVWEAERADGAFAQTAALKLLKRGLDSEQILRRFLQERQILARLAHPGIADCSMAAPPPTAGRSSSSRRSPASPSPASPRRAVSTSRRACGCWSPAAGRSRRPTSGWWSIATSSPPTSWSLPRGSRSCSTSASPSCSAARRQAARPCSTHAS
jgi:hypothetical protein